MKPWHLTALAALAAVINAFSGSAVAQSEAFPSRRIQIIVPFAVGSGIDQLAREYGELLRVQTNQPVVIENREGAAGLIGATSVARAPADGYTLLVTAHPPFAMASLLRKEPPYDVVTSYAPVARVGAVPMVAVAAASMPFKTWPEMAAYFRANPDKANYAASGTGSPGQLFLQLIKLQTGLPMQEVLYKSTGQALTDAIGGQVQLSLVSLPAGLAHIKAGSLRLLGVGSPKRIEAFPEVPSLAELIGQPGFEASVWYGFLAPAGTPAERVHKLYEEFARASASPRMQEFMTKSSIAPGLHNPQQFAASIRDDVTAARKMIEAAKLKAE